MPPNNFNIEGLTPLQVLESRNKHGSNTLIYKKENALLEVVKNLAKEPMVLLLLAASTLYFVNGATGDGIFLACSIVLVAAISLYQDKRSRSALEKLKSLSQPHCKVIREGSIIEVKSEDVVVGDSLVAEEGGLIIADGTIVHSNDFSVNESILTGESLPVYKDSSKDDNRILSGSVVSSGLAIATVTAIGNQTRLGQIGKSLESIKEEKTPLELQIGNFVKKMVIAGLLVFLIVWMVNYSKSLNILDSLLKALTLAMSILPEEIPVALTTFMALGAWRLMKMGIIVKQMKTVETLGSATVICTDKTGTITENRMSIAKLYSIKSKRIVPAENLNADEKELISVGMWASEPIPFDPMELALHEAYASFADRDERPDYKMVHEYPLGGVPPMMTHLFENAAANRIIAAKGAPEALMNSSSLSARERDEIIEVINNLTADGYRLLGVGRTTFTGNDFPVVQENFQFDFMGVIAFYDPPKQNIKRVFEDFYKAGILVKIITGDNAATASAIARQVGFRGYEKCITGEELLKFSEAELQEKVEQINVFARMFPEAKLKVINALKHAGHIVAMTGDGINDGPALKAAHIGIAMGRKGTEIAKQAASLILLDDDLASMVKAVAMGRKIYSNLKKAIQYIISIHIPIILTVFCPLILGWVYPNIFSPVHIIFLELIMGPTCSIIYESEPMEKNTMARKPRAFTATFFNWKELVTSIIQGLVITAGTLAIYQYSVNHGYSEDGTRTMVFLVLIASNIFLTLENRSFYYSILTLLRYRNKLVPLIIGITVSISVLLICVPAFRLFFGFQSVGLSQVFLCTAVGFCCVMWYEIVKFWKRINLKIE